jgi:peptidyl-prolyl cis-trans isomerase C
VFVFRAFPLALILALSVTACSNSSKTTPASTATPAAAAPKTPATPAAGAASPATPPPAATAPPASAPAGDDAPPSAAFVKPVPAQLPNVVARVNGEAVTRSDVESAIAALEQQRGPVPPAQRDRVVRGILEDMISLKLLVQESKNRKVPVTEPELDARMASLRQNYPSEEAFKSAMAAQKVTLDQVRTEQRQQLAINRMLETEVGAKAKATPEEVAKIYKERPELFQQPARVHASHILITVPADADAGVKAEALAKATKVLKDARAGKDFAALAKEFSQDPGSAARGGDLGFFGANEMVPPFSDAAFKLRPGTISDIVETQFGYHIIKVIEKQPARTVPFDEVKPQIEQRLSQEKGQREVQAFVDALRLKSKVEILI